MRKCLYEKGDTAHSSQATALTWGLLWATLDTSPWRKGACMHAILGHRCSA